MFLEQIETEYPQGYNFNKLARESSTFNAFYVFWKEHLFERVMKLFVWEGTYDENDPFNPMNVKPKEIEQRLMLAGTCGITKISVPSHKVKNELTAMYGTLHGVTKYLDEKSHFIVRCPIYTGERTIDKDVVVIDNTSLRNSIMPLIHHYAILLGHTDVTLADLMVNARDCGGIPVVATEKQKKSVEEYQGKIFNGQYGVVTDRLNAGLQLLGTDRKTGQDVKSIYEVRERLLKSFYSAIGIRSAFEKRSNSVEAEVEADSSLLQINLADMIACRELGCKRVNDLFGTNWSVHIAKEIDYGFENERIQFDDADTVHITEEDSNDENS